jgi:tetratricopeptide (TPR) repeat protein
MASLEEQKAEWRRAEASHDLHAAHAHDQAGRRDRAEALYRKVLQKIPDHPDALHLLGVIAHQRGRQERAVQLIERALTIMPEFAPAHLNLGNALKAAGRRSDALNSYRRAIELKPDYAGAWCNLAALQTEQGQLEAALASADRAIELAPDFAEAYVNRAQALLGQRRFAEVETALRRALALAPERVETYGALGMALAELGRLDEALTLHRQAIARAPKDAEPHYMLGLTLFGAQQPEAAEAAFRDALALDPRLARAWHCLGNALVALGRFDEASPCFRKALAIDPDLAEANEVLALNGEQAAGDAELDHLARLAADGERPLLDRIAAGFAVAVFHDNADRPESAFAHFFEANALCRQFLADAGERFDADAFAREMDGLIERCTPGLFAAAAGFGNPSAQPVFIVGMPRSGTSLVEQIAASHSRVFGIGERRYVSRIAEVLAANRDKPFAEWDMDLARRLADEHVGRLRALAGDDVVRVTDKTPDNIFHLGIIAVLFPQARVIFCRREARDTCLSCYLLRFGEGHAFACDLADCGRRYLDTELLAEHWRRVLPLPMLTIDYEMLVGDPERESRRLIEFLGLDWEPACLDFHRTPRPVFSASGWGVRQPIYSRSVGRWRRYERHLGPLFEVLERYRDAPRNGAQR